MTERSQLLTDVLEQTRERQTFNLGIIIECPWCGHKAQQEELYLEDGQCEDVECTSCEKEFEIRAVVSVDHYATRCDDQMARQRAEAKRREDEAFASSLRIVNEARAKDTSNG